LSSKTRGQIDATPLHWAWTSEKFAALIGSKLFIRYKSPTLRLNVREVCYKA